VRSSGKKTGGRRRPRNEGARARGRGAAGTEDAALEKYLSRASRETDQTLRKLLPPESREPQELHRAMRYSVFAGGKRFRPALVLAAAELAGGSRKKALPVAAAIEMLHTYSLIHDDLPAMDDDDFRRGRPSCHKAFGEATAILAGDALLTHAFEIIATRVKPPELAAKIAADVAGAVGTSGMLGGQARDLAAEGQPADRETVEAIHREKTAALITTSVRCGALVAGADARTLAALTRYGRKLGLAFQIADDLLDETASQEELGKAVRKDAARGKATYPAAVGLEAAREQALALARAARSSVANYGKRAGIFVALADFVVRRSR